MLTLRGQQRESEGDQIPQIEPGTQACTHTCTRPSPLRLQKSEETREERGEAKRECPSRGSVPMETGAASVSSLWPSWTPLLSVIRGE